MKYTCPLCESTKVFTVRKFSLPALRREWLASFRFDPFLAFPQLDESLRQCRCGTCALEFFSPQYVGQKEFYERLSRGNEWYYEENKWEFDEALRRLSLNPRVNTLLEFGCGKGFFLEKVAGCYDTLGMEINREAAQACKRKNLNVTTDGFESLRQQFDAIVAFEVLEHLPDPKELFRRVYQALAPGGALIIAVPNPEGYLREFDHVLLDMPPHHATRWRKTTFDYLARQLGMRIVGFADEPLRFVHYQGYLAMLASQQTPAGVFMLPARILRWLRNALVPDLASLTVRLGYQYHKQVLIGQTHLVEFRKD
jgi:2-polyprenyl-3-methyl-5-hydroxy-6-metoxy-1,4-benzoquinol methylase